MAPTLIFSYILVGLAAGFFGGLLGIGGGLITVPSLLLLFTLQNFPSENAMKVAIGTSLGAMVFTASVSAISHILKKGVNWKLFRGLAPGIFLGALISAFTVHHLSSKILQLIFGTCEILFGIYFCFFESKSSERHNIQMLNFFIFSAFGVVIGGISTLLGIGGGLITVPFLVALKTPMRNAIATSAATGFIIALVGSISFLMLGYKEVTFKGAIGYLYVPAFILIGISSMIAVPTAVHFTYTLPTAVLRKIFGTFLILTGISMLLK